jgi:hypothetical protein
MSMTRQTRPALVGLALFLWATPAMAWNPFKSAKEAVGSSIEAGGRRLGKGLGAGAVEAIQPALVSTIGTAAQAASSLMADVDTRLTRQVDHAGGVASRLVSETKGALDTSLDRVDNILEKRLLQLEVSATGAVKKLDDAIDRNLHTADDILKARSAQLGAVVSGSIAQADQALERRISQLDEDVALRLGNVDVIATKQRLGLEETLIRVGVIAGLLVFVVFVLRTMWKELATVSARVTGKRGLRRAWSYMLGLLRPVSLQIGAAVLALAVIYLLYDRLPMGARAQAAQLATMHRQQMESSLARFDFSRVRFHASQLEILVPDQGRYYQAMASKAALLRDLLVRPAILATEQGINEVVERVQALERQLGARADADVLTMKALVLWQIGNTKRDEHTAASYCARALRLSPGGFALAPLARHYIRAFLRAPYVAPDTPYGRDAEAIQDLRILAAAPLDDTEGFPLMPVIALDRLMARVDREVTAAYLDLLRAHAEVVRLGTRDPSARRSARVPVETPALLEARKTRGLAAARVVAAWRTFDQAIDSVPGLSGRSAILAIFRMNDASYARATWFLERPQAGDIAPLLSDITDLDLKTKMAPPRIDWEKRYGNLIAGELHAVAELQEANRFKAFEADARDFERAFVDMLVSTPGPQQDEQRRSAALLAAKLSLFVNAPNHKGRIPFASTLVAPDDEKEPKVAEALAAALQLRGLRTL